MATRKSKSKAKAAASDDGGISDKEHARRQSEHTKKMEALRAEQNAANEAPFKESAKTSAEHIGGKAETKHAGAGEGEAVGPAARRQARRR